VWARGRFEARNLELRAGFGPGGQLGPGLNRSIGGLHVRVAAALALGVIGMAAGSLDAAVGALIG